jgi:predicted amidophosphoribosyltransferase
VQGIYTGLKLLIFPLLCIIWPAPGFKICPTCNKAWSTSPKKSRIDQIPLYFTTEYAEDIGTLLLLAKESGNKTAIDILTTALVGSIMFLISETKIEFPINIIPIPSSKRAIRKRGRNHIEELCEVVIIKLLNNSISAQKVPVIHHNKIIKDQSNLNRSQRLQNLKNACTFSGVLPNTGSTILLDDVVTTGSSISEALRALSEAKITILGAVTACAVERNSLIR